MDRRKVRQYIEDFVSQGFRADTLSFWQKRGSTDRGEARRHNIDTDMFYNRESI